MDLRIPDYEATLQAFFKEIILFLDRRVRYVDSEIDFQKNRKAREAIVKIAANPKEYADYNARVKAGIEPDASVFMTNPRENSVWVILSSVLWSMANLNSEFEWERKDAQEKLVKARRDMEIKNSRNPFQTIKFKFMRDKKFIETKSISR